MDRFANADLEKQLGIHDNAEDELGLRVLRSTNIQTPAFTGNGFYRGRSILRSTFLIQPHDNPRISRSPWHFFGNRSDDQEERPAFIINDEGARSPLPSDTILATYSELGIGHFGYLWFRPEVLRRYLASPDYSVLFHMRNWGIASLPGGRGDIDVGINSVGMVTAFGPDIAGLPLADQSYWASFSSLPSGEVCNDLFETRMQCNPTVSPGVYELINEGILSLQKSAKLRFEVDLFNGIEPSHREIALLSVGPIDNHFNEVTNLSKILYGWLFETMSIPALRSICSQLEYTVASSLRQIKILERILILLGLSEEDSRAVTAPFVGLNDLRIGDAHIGNIEVDSCMNLMGATSPMGSPREAWALCVDSVAMSICKIDDVINGTNAI